MQPATDNATVMSHKYLRYHKLHNNNYIRLTAGQPEQAGTRKAKPFWILMNQEITGWQWHQLDRMQIICTSL